MPQRDDFQFHERVEQNIARKKNFLRWVAFGINLTCFVLYVIFLIVDISQVFHLGSPYLSVYGSMPHVLWIPLLIWLGMLIIHLGSVLLDSDTVTTLLAQRAARQEKRIINKILYRLDAAEKHKRTTSHLEDDGTRFSDNSASLSHMEIEEHPRHALL